MRLLNNFKGNKVLQAGFGYTIGNYLLKGINLLTMPLFARLMNTTDYGLFNIYMSYEGICTLLIGLALHSSVKNAKYDYKDAYGQYMSSITLMPLIMLAIALAVVLMFAKQLESLLGLGMFALCALMVHSYCSALLNFYNADLSLNYQYQSFLRLAMFNTLTNVSIALVLMLSVMKNARYTARIAGCIIPLVIISVYILIKLFSRAKPKFDKGYWSYSLKYSLPIIPHGLSQIVLSQFDRIMINSMVGASMAGIYSFAFNITTIVQVLITSLDTAYGPWYYEKAANKEFVPIRRVSSLYIYGMWCVIIAIMLLAPEIVLILGGSNYAEARFVVFPLLASTFFTFLYLLPVTTEYYLKKTGTIGLTTSCVAVLNIVLNYIFIKNYGYIAGAYTTLFCYICYLMFHYLMAKRLMGIQQFNTRLIIILSVLLLGFMICGLLLAEKMLIRILLFIVFILVNSCILFTLYKRGMLNSVRGN